MGDNVFAGVGTRYELRNLQPAVLMSEKRQQPETYTVINKVGLV